jgi:hypothetical protein
MEFAGKVHARGFAQVSDKGWPRPDDLRLVLVRVGFSTGLMYLLIQRLLIHRIGPSRLCFL